MASFASPDENEWPIEAVLLLLSLYKEHHKLFNSYYRRKDPWKFISSELAEKEHHHSGEACRVMFKGLQDRYFDIVDGFEPRDEKEQQWPFFDLMDDLMAGSPLVRPPCVVSTFPGAKLPVRSSKKKKTPHIFQTNDPLGFLCEPEALPDPIDEHDLYESLSTQCPGLPEPLLTPEHNSSASPLTHQPGLPESSTSHEQDSSVSLPTHQPVLPEEPCPTHDPTCSSKSGYNDIMRSLMLRQTKLGECSENPLLWFRTFLEKQSEKMDEHIELQKKMLEEAREKNKILRRFTEALLENR